MRSGLARQICSFCDDLSTPLEVESPSELGHKFFHRECSTCEPQQDRTLCDFCRHLRIRHLFFCDLTSDWEQGLVRIGIRYFNLSISPSRSCPFCQLLTYIIHLGEFYFPVIEEKINKGCRNTYLRLRWISKAKQTRLELCAGLVFYPIFLHEELSQWETFKRQAQSSELLLDFNRNPPLNVGKKVRWDQVRGWLKEDANVLEGGLKPRQGLDDQLKRLPDGFMLIDVKERKIVYGDRGCQFVALSYVWGDSPDNKRLSATKKTIDRLQRMNGVSAHELPATIEDAIQICIELGKQYLWVDRLCIVQDDDKNKQHQISRMASIYASASLVIVVTEGDMECGVAGVGHERPIHDIRSFSGSTFSYSLPSIEDSIQHSRWATRGWTYQEAALARTKLFFTPSQVHYMCECKSRTIFRSENFDGFSQLHSFTAKSMKLHPCMGIRLASCLFEDWEHHLEAYTARSLRQSSDIYNAFLGICSAIYIEDDAFLCGLPRECFDRALLWFCTKPTEDAPPHQIRTPEKDEQLPSWSWASVVGKVSLDGGSASDWLFCGSLVEWAVKRSGDSHLERVRHPDNPEDENRIRVAMAVAWSQGCLKQPWSFPHLSERTISSFTEGLPTRRTFARDYIRGWDKGLEEELLEELLKNHSLRDKTLLVSRAQTARFGLKKHRPHSTYRRFDASPKHHHLEIVDEEGHCIGMLSESEPRTKEEVLPYIKTDTFEFVSLSISHYNSAETLLQCVLQRDEELLKDWEDRYDYYISKDKSILAKPRGILWKRSRNLTFYDRDSVPLDPIPVVNVMLIRSDRRQSRLVHRVSIGWILLTQWAKAERQFKTIILE